jgi:hypothetical protein
MCAGYGIHPHSARKKVGKLAFSNHNKRAASLTYGVIYYN